MPYKNIEDRRRNWLKYSAKNRDKLNESKRLWKQNNPDKVKAGSIRYRKNNTGKIKLRYQSNRESILQKAKQYYYQNKERRLEVTNQYYQDNKEKIRNYQYIRKYGIASEQVEELYDKQKGLCWICGQEDKLVVDHSHATGKVRGLLCTYCNKALGHFRDSPANLAQAIKYLSKNH